MHLKVLGKCISSKLKNGNTLIDMKKWIHDNMDLIDYKKYVQYKEDTYNRNIVWKDENIEVVVISWMANQDSPIHNHTRGGCLFRVLEGILDEHLYTTQDIKYKTYTNKNGFAYIHNDIGTHKMLPKHNTVSLHIYAS